MGKSKKGGKLNQELKKVVYLAAHLGGPVPKESKITKSIAQFEEATPDIKVEEIVMDASTWQPKLLQNVIR